MTAVDWLIAGAVLLSVLLAAAQGFFYEIFSLAGVVVGYLVAAWDYAWLAHWFLPYVRFAWIADMTGFLIIFLAIVLLAGMVGRLARWAAKEAGLRWFDRLLGAAFGLLRGVLMVAVLALALATFAPQSGLLAGSQWAPYFLVVARAATWLAPSEVRVRFRQGVEEIRNFRPAAALGAGRGAASH